MANTYPHLNSTSRESYNIYDYDFSVNCMATVILIATRRGGIEYFFPSNNNFAKREDPISPLCLVKSISISILKLSAHFIQQTLTKQVYIIIIW